MGDLALKSGFEQFYTCVSLSESDKAGIQRLCNDLDVSYFEFAPIDGLTLREFYLANALKEPFCELLREMARDPGLNASISAPEARYEIEYGTLESPAFEALLQKYGAGSAALLEQAKSTYAQLPNYNFWSPVLDQRMARAVIPPSMLWQGAVVDVGTGSAQLLKALISDYGVAPAALIGIDIASSSASQVRRLGARGIVGTLPEIQSRQVDGGIPAETASATFLSYFVDRDNNQRGTFDTAVDITRKEGLIVLEGLLPVSMQDTLGIDYSKGGTTPITSGASAAADVAAIAACFKSLKCNLERVAVGERLVYSMDGFERLPTIFTVMRKEA